LAPKENKLWIRDGRNYQQIVGGSGSDCEWSQILEILCELNELHEDRLRRLDEAEIRARFEQSNVADLEEVNAMLAQIVAQLK
jgi:hypothetical protein